MSSLDHLTEAIVVDAVEQLLDAATVLSAWGGRLARDNADGRRSEDLEFLRERAQGYTRAAEALMVRVGTTSPDVQITKAGTATKPHTLACPVPEREGGRQ